MRARIFAQLILLFALFSTLAHAQVVVTDDTLRKTARSAGLAPSAPSTPTFAPFVTYDSGSLNARSAAVADLNGDGKPDLVVLNQCDGSIPTCINGSSVLGNIGVLLGNGDGTLQPAVLYSTGGAEQADYNLGDSPLGPHAIAIADVNGDGIPDLIVANMCTDGSDCNSGSVAVLLGNGDGTFQPAVNYDSGGSYASSLAVADLNGDGKPDIVVTNQCQGNIGDGCYVNSGGFLVLSNGTVGVLLGNGDGTFQSAVAYAPNSGSAPYSVSVGDLNGDGQPDLVVVSSSAFITESGGSDTVSVLLGNGDGTFQTAMVYGTGGHYAYDAAIGDLNGDGKPDLVIANVCASGACGNGTAGVLLGNGDGTFQTAISYSAGPGGNAFTLADLALADIDGDGNLDVVFANYSASGTQGADGSVGILLGNGDGTFQSPVSFDAGYAVTSITVADLNGDKRPDVAVVNIAQNSNGADGGISILLNQTQQAKLSTVTTLVSIPDPSVYNQALTLAATVAGSGSNVPTGTVNFSSGAVNLGSATVIAGTANLTLLTPLSAGSYSFVASYGGDANFSGSTSSVFTEIVNAASSSCTVTASANPIAAFQPGALNAVIFPQDGGAATGTVTFADNGSPLATSTVNADSASAAVQFMAGTHAISVVYSGDTNVTSSQCSATLVVNQAASTLTITALQGPIALGQTASFAVTVSPQFAGGTPTGNVTFNDGSLVLATLQLAQGAVTFSSSSLAVGSHMITATYGGDANFKGSSGSALQLVILPATVPVFTSANSTTFAEQTQSSFLVTASGNPTPTFTETGALPGGVTFADNGNGTGTISGTPVVGSAGTYPITLTATNAAGSATQSFTLSVIVGLAITSGSSTTFTVGNVGVFTLTTVGSPTAALTESGALPSGVTFVDNGNGTGTISGTPAPGTVGSYAIAFTANNGVGSVTQNFTLVVNQGPAITSGSATTFAVGVAGSFLITSSGTPTPALTETGPLPTGVAFVDNGNGTATLSGTPAPGSGGSYPISITAANGIGTNATQSFTLTVNQSLAITSGSMTTFTVSSTGFFSVLTSGVPVPTLSETGTLPSGVTFVDNGNGTATLSGTPAANTGGSYPMTIDASDGGIEPDAIQSFTLVVNQGAAILTGNSTTFTVGTPGSFTVNTTGVPTAALTESGALPSGISFNDNGNGTASLGGTPAAGTAGSYPVTFTAYNGAGTAAMQSFTLTVNQGPAITSTNMANFAVQVVGSFTVTATGAPTPVLTETGALPSGVTFVDNGNGTASLGGTPAGGTNGQYGFTIQASNGVLPSATQTFTLTVSGGLSFVSGNATTFVTGTPGSFTAMTSGSPVPLLSMTGMPPVGVTFTDNGDGTGTLAGTAATGSAGVYSLTFIAHNGVSPDATQTFTLTIAANQTRPVITWANPAPINQGEALGSIQLNATANVPGTFTYSPGAGAVLSSGTHILIATFTPTNLGAYTTATATVLITVLGDTPYTIGGTVSGLRVGESLVLLDNGGNALKVVNTVKSRYPKFLFTQVLAAGATYNVTVGTQPVGQICAVAQGSGTASGNVTSVAVSCRAAATIGGTVSGLEAGESLVLLNNGADALMIQNRLNNPSVPFAFSTALANGATFDVTVGTQPLRQICTVFHGTGSVSSATNVTSIAVECKAGNTIGGTVSGLRVGESLVLLDNGGNALKVVNTVKSRYPKFLFTQVLAAGATYNVTVGTQPVGQICAVAQGSGTASGNVTSVAVSCRAAATIGGTVSGLEAGESLVLLNNGGDALMIQNHLNQPSVPFVFSTALAKGATFDVTVGTQPLRQICTVLHGTGSVVSSINVTSIAVECQ
jgi:predicted SpoU family rRNA methylase